MWNYLPVYTRFSGNETRYKRFLEHMEKLLESRDAQGQGESQVAFRDFVQTHLPRWKESCERRLYLIQDSIDLAEAMEQRTAQGPK